MNKKCFWLVVLLIVVSNIVTLCVVGEFRDKAFHRLSSIESQLEQLRKQNPPDPPKPEL